MRNWGLTFALLFVIWTVPAWAQDAKVLAVESEVVVVGATPGGIAAAVAAARCGRSVVLVEAEDHVGGIVSNGLTNADIANRQAVGGLFYQFTRRVLDYYKALDGKPDGPNVKLSRDGYWYEASVAERIFRDMLGEHKGLITVMTRHALRSAQVDGHQLIAVTVIDLATQNEVMLQAKVFIDATYEGDLAALAGAKCRLGRESRDEFGEPHAGFVFTRFGETELLPGSTGAADNAIEAFCFRMHVTKNPANLVPVEKPDGYRREDYALLLDQLASRPQTKLREVIQFFPMPNEKFELNSNHPDPVTGIPCESFDLAEENWSWTTATLAERQKIYERYLTHNVGLLWLLQHDSAVPAAIRDEALKYGWCRDEWPDHGHLPRQVYVRQGRRVMGMATVTERDGDLDPQTQRTPMRRDSIAIAEFAFDSHACHRYDPSHPGVREGYIFIKHEPLQLPYGILVPETIDGLLVPVACSSSHVGYQAIRMEPLFMALGEACGEAAHLAIQKQQQLREVDVAALQTSLVSRGAVICHLNDLPFNHLAFAPLQWLGARGFNQGYLAEPDKQLTVREGAARFARVCVAEGINWKSPSDSGDEPLTPKVMFRWLREAGLEPRSSLFADDSIQLTTAQFATIVYVPFRNRE
ncbi:FAD-dependent oxidoreductase [Planctomicrobium piriforme]|uniref:FAD dependent oxidoreductase n=1 Tax=Planctomicrobium piriforme TaxID=1576369 RepID=A0A1I3AVW4_9PLAN|nr:FAD-dependent oxidoreductase [Planctomicrobium piriforme]SFH54154.1 FAD dependent oxidoreductase [Planctomicrobium piriforme]